MASHGSFWQYDRASAHRARRDQGGQWLEWEREERNPNKMPLLPEEDQSYDDSEYDDETDDGYDYEDDGYDGEDESSAYSSDEGYRGSSLRFPTAKECVAMVVSGTTMALQGMSFAMTKIPFVKVASVMGGAIAPLCTIQQVRITTHETRGNRLRDIINYLRDEANRLEEQNSALALEIDGLEDEVEKVKDVEQQLSRIAKTQGKTVDHLVRLVKTNAETVRKMKKNIKAKTLQDIIALVVKADRDGDFTIDERELRLLTLKLDAHLQAQGIQMDVEMFLEETRDDPTLEGVMKTAKKLMDEDEEEGSSRILFKIDFDSFRQSYRKKSASRGASPFGDYKDTW